VFSVEWREGFALRSLLEPFGGALFDGNHGQASFAIVGDSCQRRLNGCLGKATPAHTAEPITALPRAEDLFDPTKHPMDRLAPRIEPRQRFLFVASPYRGRDEARRSVFRVDRFQRMLSRLALMAKTSPRLSG
jgi:hypothetical protein